MFFSFLKLVRHRFYFECGHLFGKLRTFWACVELLHVNARCCGLPKTVFEKSSCAYTTQTAPATTRRVHTYFTREHRYRWRAEVCNEFGETFIVHTLENDRVNSSSLSVPRVWRDNSSRLRPNADSVDTPMSYTQITGAAGLRVYYIAGVVGIRYYKIEEKKSN